MATFNTLKDASFNERWRTIANITKPRDNEAGQGNIRALVGSRLGQASSLAPIGAYWQVLCEHRIARVCGVLGVLLVEVIFLD
jgi:hypothetical protein